MANAASASVAARNFANSAKQVEKLSSQIDQVKALRLEVRQAVLNDRYDKLLLEFTGPKSEKGSILSKSELKTLKTLKNSIAIH